MDFDLNATLINYQNYHAVTHFRQRIAAAATPPRPTLPASTPTDTPPGKSAAYNDLPNEVILRLGSHVPIEDMGSFAAIDSRTYQLLRDKRLIWSYWERANKVVSLSSLKRVLGEIEEGISNPQERVEPIKALQRRLHILPPAQRPAAFKQMFTMAKSIPVDGGQLQKAMIAMLRDFPEWQRLDLFQFVVEMVEAYGPEQENFWLDFQEALPSLTSEPSQFVLHFQELINRLTYLSEPEQAKLIPVLCDLLTQFAKHAHRSSNGIYDLHPFFMDWITEFPGQREMVDTWLGAVQIASVEERPIRYTEMIIFVIYEVLRERTIRLPPSHQGAAVGTLAAASSILPARWRRENYLEMRNFAMSLPDEQWWFALGSLPLATLDPSYTQHHEPDRIHREEISRFLERSARARMLPAEPTQRFLLAFSLLKGSHFVCSDATLLKRLWQQGLTLLDGTGDSSLYHLLEALSAEGTTGAMDKTGKKIAIDEIENFMRRNNFSDKDCAKMVQYPGLY